MMTYRALGPLLSAVRAAACVRPMSSYLWGASHASHPSRVAYARREEAVRGAGVRADSAGARLAIVGASSRAARAAAKLLCASPSVEHLALYDEGRRAARTLRPTAAALAHEPTGRRVAVEAYAGRQQLAQALQNCDVILVMNAYDGDEPLSMDKLFNINAPIIQQVATAAALAAPRALLAVLAPPVNRTLPLAAEAMAAVKHPAPGVRALGKAPGAEAAASRLAARAVSLDPQSVEVPLVGGTCHLSAVPLLSAAQPQGALALEEPVAQKLRKEIRSECCGGTGALRRGPSPLLEGRATARLAERLADACLGRGGPLLTSALVRCSLIPGMPYFASIVRIGRCGVEGCLGLPRMTPRELELLDSALMKLSDDISSVHKFLRRQTEASAALQRSVRPPPTHRI